MMMMMMMMISKLRDYCRNTKPQYVPFKKYPATFISSHRNCTDSFETLCIYSERSRNIYVIFPFSAPRRGLPTTAHIFVTNQRMNTAGTTGKCKREWIQRKQKKSQIGTRNV